MQYDGFAIRLKSEYELFLFALTGRYLSLMAPGAGVSPMQINDLERAALALRETFMQSAIRAIKLFVGSSDLDTLKTLSQDFETQLSAITKENVDSLVNRMKGAKVNALDAVGDVHGAMGLLLQQKLATPEFTATSTSGRIFQAAPFVKAQARQFAYQSWLQLMMVALSWEGDLAQVVYNDPGHENNGLVFSMSGATPGYPSFEDIAQTVFHYNATAQIAAHVPS